MKKTTAEKIITWVAFAIFFIYAATLIFPFIWMVLNSLKTHQEFFQDIWGFPATWRFSNYVEALSVKVGGFTFIEVILNSIIYTLIMTFITIIVPLCAAYAVSKYKFKLRGVCVAVTIIMLTVPVVGDTAATFKLLKTFNLYNKWYWGLFLMSSGGFNGNFLLIRAALDNTSWTYAEAGFIDGASDFKVMTKIMLPMVTPIMIILSIMGIIGSWNEYMAVWLYSPAYPTVGVAVKQLTDNLSSSEASYPKLFALMGITLVPVLAIFIAFQKTIMNNFSLGGLKG